jgi:hypothetical protein
MQRVLQQHVGRCELVDDLGFQGRPQNSVKQRPTIVLLSALVAEAAAAGFDMRVLEIAPTATADASDTAFTANVLRDSESSDELERRDRVMERSPCV